MRALERPTRRGYNSVGATRVSSLHALAGVFGVETEGLCEQLPGLCWLYMFQRQYRRSILRNYPHLWLEKMEVDVWPACASGRGRHASAGAQVLGAGLSWRKAGRSADSATLL